MFANFSISLISIQNSKFREINGKIQNNCMNFYLNILIENQINVNLLINKSEN